MGGVPSPVGDGEGGCRQDSRRQCSLWGLLCLVECWGPLCLPKRSGESRFDLVSFSGKHQKKKEEEEKTRPRRDLQTRRTGNSSGNLNGTDPTVTLRRPLPDCTRLFDSPGSVNRALILVPSLGPQGFPRVTDKVSEPVSTRRKDLGQVPQGYGDLSGSGHRFRGHALFGVNISSSKEKRFLLLGRLK